LSAHRKASADSEFELGLLKSYFWHTG